MIKSEIKSEIRLVLIERSTLGIIRASGARHRGDSTGAREPDFDPKWGRLAPNGTNPGIFQTRFQ